MNLMKAVAAVLEELHELPTEDARKVVRILDELVNEAPVPTPRPSNGTRGVRSQVAGHVAKASPAYVGLQEACKLKGATKGPIFHALQRGELKGKKVGGRRLIERTSLEAWSYKPRPYMRKD